MKIVRVIYTAKSEYAEQNQVYINKVMSDLQSQNHPGLRYNCCLSADGKTFTHTAFFGSADDEKLLVELPSFKLFQERLKAGGLEIPPKQEALTLVGSSYPIFRMGSNE